MQQTAEQRERRWRGMATAARDKPVSHRSFSFMKCHELYTQPMRAGRLPTQAALVPREKHCRARRYHTEFRGEMKKLIFRHHGEEIFFKAASYTTVLIAIRSPDDAQYDRPSCSRSGLAAFRRRRTVINSSKRCLTMILLHILFQFPIPQRDAHAIAHSLSVTPR